MKVERLWTLIVKEARQLLRDRISLSIGILLPIVLLLIFGYGMSMDIKNVKLAVVVPRADREANDLFYRFAASKYFVVSKFYSTTEAEKTIIDHQSDACLYFPEDIRRDLQTGQLKILLTVNAINPTRARMIENYVKSILLNHFNTGQDAIEVKVRILFNEANDSSYYMIPGVIVIIMTIIGGLLTSMVMAREYERGNLEGLFATPVRSSEILLAKALNNFVLGMIGLLISIIAARHLFGVPIRGNLFLLITGSALYLMVALGLGLFVSSLTKNQFFASQITLMLTFLPAFLLSGFLYEIGNMPILVQYVTVVVPARYYMEFLQTIFLAGDVWPIIWKNLAVLAVFAFLFLLAAKLTTPKRLEIK